MIQRIAVVGAGTMGVGIAQLCAQSGFSVKIHDAVPAALEAVPGKIKKGLDLAVLKGKLTTQQAERAYHSVDVAVSLSSLAGADLVIEAASEDSALKRRLFQELGKVCSDSILATNTSSLSVASLSEMVPHPGNVLGIHFFNPPVAMKLVEMIRTDKTSPDVFREAWEFVLMGLRKTPVDVKDTPGFIVNRVMRPYYVESQRAFVEGRTTIAFIDQRARDFGAPMGPFELMDLIGLDVNLAITRSIYEALGRPERFVPPALQEALVAAGELGRKTRRGFYLYDEAGRLTGVNERASGFLPERGCAGPPRQPEDVWPRVKEAVRAEAQRAFEEGVAGKADIDLAVKLAMNFPKGPFEWPKESPLPSASKPL